MGLCVDELRGLLRAPGNEGLPAKKARGAKVFADIGQVAYDADLFRRTLLRAQPPPPWGKPLSKLVRPRLSNNPSRLNHLHPDPEKAAAAKAPPPPPTGREAKPAGAKPPPARREAKKPVAKPRRAEAKQPVAAAPRRAGAEAKQPVAKAPRRAEAEAKPPVAAPTPPADRAEAKPPVVAPPPGRRTEDEPTAAETRAYWTARERAGAAAVTDRVLCRARARRAHAPVEPTELGLATDQRVLVLRTELTATPGWVFATRDGNAGYVPRTYLQPATARAPAEPAAAPKPEAKAAVAPAPPAREAKAAAAPPPAEVKAARPEPAAPPAAEPKAAAPRRAESKSAGTKRKSKREAVREEIRARAGMPVPRLTKFGNNRAALAEAPPAVQAAMLGTLKRAATEARQTIKRNDDIVAATLRRAPGGSPPPPSAFFARRRESDASVASSAPPTPAPPSPAVVASPVVLMPSPPPREARRLSTSPAVVLPSRRRDSDASVPPSPPPCASPAVVRSPAVVHASPAVVHASPAVVHASPAVVRAAASPAAEAAPPAAERWAKFWEPMQRCFYFVSDASGESRWAAHFDEDVMVVETAESVTYVHHKTLEPVDGPAEEGGATGAAAVCNWQTMIDPVSGQVYYYSRLSGAARWTPPTWTDYYDPQEGCVYYVHRTTGASAWEEPPGFREEAEALEPEEAADEAPEDDAKHAGEPAAVDATAAKAQVLFSYRKRPTAPWDPHGRTMRRRPAPASPAVVPSRELQFGDTLVLGDITLLD